MSKNPFESPENQVEPPVKMQAPAIDSKGKRKLPGTLMFICVACLLLGIFGLFGGCMNGLFLTFQNAFIDLISGLPGQNAEAKAVLEITFDAQAKMLIPTIIMTVAGAITAILLIAGSIGCLQSKPSGRKRLNLALLCAIFYSVLKIIVLVWVQFASASLVQEAIDNYAGDANIDTVRQMFSQSTFQNIAMAVVGAIFAIVLMAFYCWAKQHLKSETVNQHFAASEIR